MKRRNRIKLAFRRGAARAFVLAPLTFLLVAGAGCPSLFESPTQRAVKIKAAQPGRDLTKNVAAGTSVVVNAYTALAANAAAGATTITVGAVAALTTHFTTGLAEGDLLLIIQMQGAAITVGADDSTDGAVSNLNNAGHYELVGVQSVNTATNAITVSCPLKKAYTAAGKTQVIRVPQYTTLTIAATGSIVADLWDPTTGLGGIVAVHAQDTVQLNGSINVAGLGFRGGVADTTSGTTTGEVLDYFSTQTNRGAQKGESIAGYNYAAGRFTRGAPANGGGGGNSHNAGGGGGANAASGAAWTGQGVMTSCTVATPGAWSRDDAYKANPAGANTCSTSQGGGRGGYSYSANNVSPTAADPGDCASWGGNCRRDVGGLGGRPVPNDPATALFMGGGGGAGDGNDGSPGNGGNGGGLVFLIAGQITGTGSIVADGGDGGNAVFVAGNPGNDAAGGGGGGGTIVVHAGSVSAISLSAKGGHGGNHSGANGTYEVEGPGGGGGGGYIAVSAGSATTTVAGGLAGATDRAPVAAAFAVNGATAGNAGLANGSAASFLYCSTLPVTTISAHPTDPSTSSTGTFNFTNTSTPVTYQCKLDAAVAWTSCNASYVTGTLADGSHTLSVQSTDAFGNQEATPVVFTWAIDTSVVTTITGHPNNPSSSKTGTFTFTNTATATPVTYQCKLDDPAAAWTACTASYTTPELGDGSHTLYVRGTDAAAKVEDPPATFTWVIDTTPPNTTIDSKPPAQTGSPFGIFAFGSNETPVTFECQLDGAVGTATWTACAAAYTTSPLNDGAHNLAVRAKDAAGNVDATPETYSWTVNTGMPVTTIATHPEAISNQPTGIFTFTNTRDPVTYECKLAGATIVDWTACTATYTTGTLADGDHTLSVRATSTATDGGALVEDPPATFTWKTDTVPPDTSITSNPPGLSTSPIGTFTFTATETPVTYQCKIDDGAWATCGASYATPPLANGTHTLSVRATDAAGNVDQTPATSTWAIAAPANDGGGEIVDGGTSEAGGGKSDVPPVPPIDAQALDTERADVGGGVDLGLVIDVSLADGPGKQDGPAADLADGLAATGAEPSPDTAPVVAVEPNRDAAPAQADAPPVVNNDAAVVVVVTTPKLLGGGFCAIAPSRTASPAAFLVLALAGLALLRRRRR